MKHIKNNLMNVVSSGVYDYGYKWIVYASIANINKLEGYSLLYLPRHICEGWYLYEHHSEIL